MPKQVQWAFDVEDTVIKRFCLCEGCPHCKHKTDMYCSVFTQHKCKECKEYRCHNCLYNKDICNYCMRIV